MMDGVGAAPEVIGRQRHHADHPAHPIVSQAMAKKGTMAAIVLNHEQSYEKARGRHRKQQGEPPVAEMQRCPGQHPQRCKRHERDHNLHCAADVIGFAIAREDLRPLPNVGRQERTSSGSDVFQYRAVIRGYGGELCAEPTTTRRLAAAP
jgi:hypothetical protein